MTAPGAPALPVRAALPVRIARAAVAHPAVVLCTALLVVALAGWRIAHLRLETSFTELLPERDPAVVVLHELDRRMAALSSLSVVVEGPDPAANRAAAAGLRDRLAALHDPRIDAVVSGLQEERAFFLANRWLYASLDQLADAESHLRRAVARQNPLFVDLEDDSDGGGSAAARGDSLARVEADFDRAPASLARFPDDAFCSTDGRLCAVVIWLRSSLLGSARNADATVARVRGVVDAWNAEHPGADVSVGLTGNLITAAAERRALAADLGLVTLVTVVLVCLAVWAYFRRLGAVPLMVAPTLVGTSVALAFAQLAFGQLNTATAFLGAIIVGNGINYAIVQLARYDEERAAGRTGADAAVAAVAASWRGTATAAIGAALAYGTLVLTDFRGYYQFGWIGAVGMIASWLATISVLPAAWALLGRAPRSAGSAPALAPIAAPARRWLAPARAVLRRPALVLGGAAAITLAAVLVLAPYARDPFEYNFARLRNQSARFAESERLSTKASTIFGRSLSPSFVLADRPEQAPEIKRALLDGERSHGVLGSVQIIDDFLPGTPEEQRAKLTVLTSLRELIDANAERAGDDHARLLRLRPPDALRVLSARDLPASVRRYYTERDGTIGRVVVYTARPDVSVWDGRVQTRLASLVRQIRLDDGSTVRSSGPAVVFAGMLDAIRHDGPRLTLISLLGVVLLLAAAVGAGAGAAAILGSLVLGAVWMLGGLAAAGVRLNFLNFVALPLTFGIAVDYAANVYLRYRADGPGSLAHAIATTGSAVALCSLTTIIGYGSLLIADTQALRTFGIAAVLGEVACLATALLVLPAALVLVERRRTAPAGGPP